MWGGRFSGSIDERMARFNNSYPFDWRMWADDRIHLTTQGHQRAAAAALCALGQPVEPGWDEVLPPQPAAARAEQLRGHAQWVRTHMTPWVQRRLRGDSSGAALSAKRPDLTPIDPTP